MNPLLLIKAGRTARKAFRRWRDTVRAKEAIAEFQKEHGSVSNLPKDKPMLKGKLTYSAVIGIIAPVVSALAGFEVLSADILPFYQAFLAGVALYGRWRANK